MTYVFTLVISVFIDLSYRGTFALIKQLVLIFEGPETTTTASTTNSITTIQEAETTSQSLQTTAEEITTQTTTSYVTTDGTVDTFSTALPIENTTADICDCSCTSSLNPDDPDYLIKLYAKLESIRTELSVEKRSLSKAKRRLTSAPDERPSSKYIGALGISILLVVGLALVLPDFVNVSSWILDKINNRHKIDRSKIGFRDVASD